MAQIIDFSSRAARLSDNLVSSGPLEFRQAHWETVHFIQMLRSDSLEFERKREQTSQPGNEAPVQLPSHFSVKGGRDSTIRALFIYRDVEEKMREVYFLAGLIDCMINQVSPILRTALLRDMYNRIFLMKKRLDITWYGPLDQVLLPIAPRFFNVQQYQAALRAAATMKDLYERIRKGTREMFDIISRHYVFYLPRVRA
jgi:hypothetical protein